MKARIVAWAEPERFVTLTRAPEDWGVMRQKMRDLPRLLRRRGVKSWEHAWAVEETKAGVPHVHLLQRGQYVAQRMLQEVWGSIVDIRAIHNRAGATSYAMKEALAVAGYATKGGRESLVEHLDRNGGRVMHLSRGYLKGHTQEEVRRILTQRGEHQHSWTPYSGVRA